MNRRVDFGEWQRVRNRINAPQAAILARDDRPAGLGTLRSHRPRSDDEWQAIADGVRALLAERVTSGRWVWTGRRRLTIV